MEDLKESEKIKLSAVAESSLVAGGSASVDESEQDTSDSLAVQPEAKSSVSQNEPDSKETPAPRRSRFDKFKDDPDAGRKAARRVLKLAGLVCTTGLLALTFFFLPKGVTWWQAQLALKEGIALSNSGNEGKALEKLLWACTFVNDKFDKERLHERILQDTFNGLGPEWGSYNDIGPVHRNRLNTTVKLIERLKAAGMFEDEGAATCLEELARRCYEGHFFAESAKGYAMAADLRWPADAKELPSNYLLCNAWEDKFKEALALAAQKNAQSKKAFDKAMRLHNSHLELQLKDPDNYRNDTETIRQLAAQFEELGELGSAERLLQSAISKDDPTVQYYSATRYLAQFYASHGRKREALALLGAAMGRILPHRPDQDLPEPLAGQYNAIKSLHYRIANNQELDD